jgi:protein-tyrosine-phosphatase/DNA-binding transcriptional ArsR family regulator
MYCRRVANTRQGSPVPPAFLPLAAHPVRWSLLSELAASDRSVRQLCAAVDREQSLVSYHLGRLRQAGLATARRSSADGRDTYYRLDLQRCRSLLSAAGSAIHPGLGVRAEEPSIDGVSARVLFLCTGNSGRSQMAEALLGQRTGPSTVIASAGSRPKPIHPHAVTVMAERGIDISAWRSKHLDEVTDRPWDHVVTLCDRVREVCPDFGIGTRRIHWSTPDPSAPSTPGADTVAAFRQLAEDLDQRIEFLLPLIHTTAQRQGAHPT